MKADNIYPKKEDAGKINGTGRWFQKD